MTQARRGYALVLMLALVITMLATTTSSRAAVETPVKDSFDRTTGRGWGIAEKGGTWILDSDFGASVDGSKGVMDLPNFSDRYAYLPSNVTGDYDVSAKFIFPEIPEVGAGVRSGLTLKRLGDSYYMASVRVNSMGYAFLSLHAVSSPWLMSRLTVEEPIGVIESGGEVNVAAKVGAGATGFVQAKAWIGNSEVPTAYQVGGASSSIPAEGKVGVRFNSGYRTAVPVAVDDLVVTQGTPEEENQAPEAAIGTETLFRLIQVDAADSVDPDGTITSYVWNYGDGTSANGARPQPHRFAEAGTYEVTLTVTDDKGATDTVTESVTVSAYELPNESNTGVPEGTKLTKLTSSNVPYPGDFFGGAAGYKFVIETPGAVYDGYEFVNNVEVRAPGVQIKNSYLKGAPTYPNDSALVLVYDPDLNDSEVPSVVIEDSTLIPQKKTREIDGVRGSNFELTRVEITGTVDGAHIWGRGSRSDPAAGNVTIQRSWIHDTVYYFPDDNHDDGTHNDGVQIRGGSNFVFIGNRFDGTIRNAVVQVTQATQDVAEPGTSSATSSPAAPAR